MIKMREHCIRITVLIYTQKKKTVENDFKQINSTLRNKKQQIYKK